ncbi:hypothetical protein VULLAG_LOCUS4419 [Vulpes lagopus]
MFLQRGLHLRLWPGVSQPLGPARVQGPPGSLDRQGVTRWVGCLQTLCSKVLPGSSVEDLGTGTPQRWPEKIQDEGQEVGGQGPHMRWTVPAGPRLCPGPSEPPQAT